MGKSSALVVRRVSDVEAAAVEWVWPYWVPLGKLTMLDGDPGVGKSTIALDLAARVSVGATMPDGSEGRAGVAMVLSAEDDVADTIRPRLEAAGADLDRVVFVDLERGLPSIVDEPEDLDAALEEHSPSLLVIDPLTTFMGNQTKTNQTESTSQAMYKLKELVAERNCGGLLIRHLNKNSKETNSKYRGTNSISILGAARSGLLVAQDPRDPARFILSVTKSNLAPSEMTGSIAYEIESYEGKAGVTSKINWLGASEYLADDLLRDGADHRSSPREGTKAWLRRALADGPMPSVGVLEVGRSLGFSESMIKRSKKELGIRSVKAADGSWSWSLETSVG
jgi:hypothetical protein